MRKICFLLVALVAMTCSLHAQDYLTFTAEKAAASGNIMSLMDKTCRKNSLESAIVQSSVIYSWESPEGTVIEKGGTAEAHSYKGEVSRLNYVNQDAAGNTYYTMCLNGKPGNFAEIPVPAADDNNSHIHITLDQALAAGDKISITAYRNKGDSSKRSSAYICFGNSSFITTDDYTYNDLGYSGLAAYNPSTFVFEVPESAAGIKSLLLTRNFNATNLYITKLEITRQDAPTEVDYLTFTAEEAGATIKFNGPSCEYRLSGQKTWTSNNGSVITLAKIGDQVQFRCKLDKPMTEYSSSDENYYHFTIPKKVAASGNIMSLMDKTCSKVSLGGAWFAFYGLFKDCTGLTSAPELPATTLDGYCYGYMFSGCTGLTSAPELPATTLTGGCYYVMFEGCTGLTSAPELPATTLAESCYASMFSGCTGLTSAPALPATTLAYRCYRNMFSGCTSLTSAPELPATTLAKYCYESMFKGCMNLVVNTFGPGIEWSIPSNAVTATDWNKDMFNETSGSFTGEPEPGTVYYIVAPKVDYLTFTAEEAGATIQFDGPSCEYRLAGQETWTHNDGSVITLANVGVQVQFRCELDEPMTKYSSYGNYYHFTIPKKVAASGNIMSLMDKTCRKVSLGGASRAFSGLFKDCTGLTSAPVLPAIALDYFCYDSMFKGCTGLTSAPELPATTLKWHCYDSMFKGCTGLTSAPELPATTLSEDCYYAMFSGCTGLTSAPELPATKLAESCYDHMFYDCKSLVINTAGPGKEWSIPANVVTKDAWNNTMFTGTSGNFTGDPESGVVYYIASDPTGIDTPIEDIDHAAATYNLNGQQVGADAKGLLIQNGRKMLKR